MLSSKSWCSISKVCSEGHFGEKQWDLVALEACVHSSHQAIFWA